MEDYYKFVEVKHHNFCQISSIKFHHLGAGYNIIIFDPLGYSSISTFDIFLQKAQLTDDYRRRLINVVNMYYFGRFADYHPYKDLPSDFKWAIFGKIEIYKSRIRKHIPLIIGRFLRFKLLRLWFLFLYEKKNKDKFNRFSYLAHN